MAATVAVVAAKADTCHVARPGAGSTRRWLGREQHREQAEFSFCLNLFNGMTRSRRHHHHQLHQLQQPDELDERPVRSRGPLAWLPARLCRLPTADRGAHKLGPGHKSQSNYSELLSTGQRRQLTYIHTHTGSAPPVQPGGRQAGG